MTNAAIVLSLVIVAFLAAYAVRGWRRGLVVEVIELVGLVFAILVAFLAWPAIRSIASGWVAALGGAFVFFLIFVGALVAAGWAGRQTAFLPRIGIAIDGVGGTVVATIWSALLATALLILAVTAPGARAHLATPICESPVARAMISNANPLHAGGERLAVLGRPVLLWLNQQLTQTVALSHNRLCDDLPHPDSEGAPDPTYFEFPQADDDEIEIDGEAEQEVFRLLNRARAENGLPPLEWDEELAVVGRDHSRDMYVRGYFAHETPECREHGRDHPDCKDPFDRMRDHGITYAVAGENLALAPTPGQAHDGLMRSPGHRANILNPDFTRGGVGVYQGPFGIMVTQQFAG